MSTGRGSPVRQPAMRCETRRFIRLKALDDPCSPALGPAGLSDGHTWGVVHLRSSTCRRPAISTFAVDDHCDRPLEVESQLLVVVTRPLASLVRTRGSRR